MAPQVFPTIAMINVCRRMMHVETNVTIFLETVCIKYCVHNFGTRIWPVVTTYVPKVDMDIGFPLFGGTTF
jgi:hypothetical protein